MPTDPELLRLTDAAKVAGRSLHGFQYAVDHGAMPKPTQEKDGKRLWSRAEVVEARRKRDQRVAQKKQDWYQTLDAAIEALREDPVDMPSELRDWVDRQVHTLRYRPRHISEERTKALKKVGITKDTPTKGEVQRDALRKRFLSELDAWVAEHGTAMVPQEATGRVGDDGVAYPLGVRVSSIRGDYASGQLGQDMIDELEARPGWVWDAVAGRWEARLRRVKQNYPNISDEDRAWLSRQHQRMGKLPPERQMMVLEVPYRPQARLKKGVDKFVAAARVWLQQNKRRDMSDLLHDETVDLGEERYPLGKRALYYRRRQAGLEPRAPHPLPEAERRKLERLRGWTWHIDSTPRYHS